MEILKIRTSKLTNDAHLQFHTEVKEAIDDTTPAVLGIEVKYAPYIVSYTNEVNIINLIKINPHTQKVTGDDQNRDNVFGGLRDKIKSDLKHFVAAKREAAERLQRVFDHYGNIAVKSYDEETVEIKGIVKELRGEYAADITLLGYPEWVDELERLNNVFVATIKQRDDYDAGKTGLRMVNVRKEIDNQLRKLLKAIEVLADLNETELYTKFIAQVNVIIGKYKTKIAVREGRNSKDNKEETGQV